MKNSMSTKVFAFLALAMFASLAFASSVSAGNAVIRTVPESSWIPGNTYRVDIYADNTGLEGQSTASIAWQLIPPAQLAQYMTITQANWASSNDFFAGFSTAWSLLGANWNAHGKAVWGAGPADRQGLVASYYINLNANAPHGQYSFKLNPSTTDFVNSAAESQPYVVENVPFIVPITTKMTGVTKVGTAPLASGSASEDPTSTKCASGSC